MFLKILLYFICFCPAIYGSSEIINDALSSYPLRNNKSMNPWLDPENNSFWQWIMQIQMGAATPNAPYASSTLDKIPYYFPTWQSIPSYQFSLGAQFYSFISLQFGFQISSLNTRCSLGHTPTLRERYQYLLIENQSPFAQIKINLPFFEKTQPFIAFQYHLSQNKISFFEDFKRTGLDEELYQDLKTKSSTDLVFQVGIDFKLYSFLGISLLASYQTLSWNQTQQESLKIEDSFSLYPQFNRLSLLGGIFFLL